MVEISVGKIQPFKFLTSLQNVDASRIFRGETSSPSKFANNCCIGALVARRRREFSPRKMREASAFWSEVKNLRGADGRDKCWEDAAFLPMPDDLSDVKAFLDSVTVPDDLSGLI